jgi:hypothetical protein
MAILREISPKFTIPKNPLNTNIDPAVLEQFGFDPADYPDTSRHYLISLLGRTENEGLHWKYQARVGIPDPEAELPWTADQHTLGTAKISRTDGTVISAHDAWNDALQWLDNRREIESYSVAPQQDEIASRASATEIIGVLLVKAAHLSD